MDFESLRERLTNAGQEHVLRHWSSLNEAEQQVLSAQIESLDFPLLDRLVSEWISSKPAPHEFEAIEPPQILPKSSRGDVRTEEANAAGEAALRAGRVGLVLVAGGQGTRLGFDGPKGAFPIGPLTGRTLFEYHADKILNAQESYGCVLPWYVMVGDSNAEATREFFAAHKNFGLDSNQIYFFQQRMMPCIDSMGKLILEAPGRLAMNPNGHGGCIPALVENGILDDARSRGIDTLSYFQVDNWVAQIADPVFIGHHVLANSEMSSKATRKVAPREAAGVFCVCDGVARVIEYTELDLYPKLLESDDSGDLLFYAANPAIHILDVDFVERVHRDFARFPWHCSHKKIPHCSESGERIEPTTPNGYKFETFVFDALEFCERTPVLLEIEREGEFTPTKQMTGVDSVEAAQESMSSYWGAWLKAAGYPHSLDGVRVEISPRFAWDEEEFVSKAAGFEWPESGDFVIGPEGLLSIA